MTSHDLAGMFNRSWSSALSVRKFLFMFLALILVGLIFLFFQAITFSANPWMTLAFRYAPFFVASAVLMAVGTFLIKTYLAEQEGESLLRGERFKTTFVTSSKPLLTAFLCPFALLLAFVVLWIVLGLFILLKSIPYIGAFFGVILAFVPFLLNLSILLLLVAVLGALFFITPILAQKNHIEGTDLSKRLKPKFFTQAITFALALVPVWIIWLVVRKAAIMTFEVYSSGDNQVVMVLQAFFMLIPFAAAMAFPLIYFFNFASESYQLTTED